MTDEEAKKLQDENAKLKADNEKLVTDNKEYKETNEDLVKDSAASKETIETLTKNAREQGVNFKKLRDMSDKEKELLSDKEVEIIKRQEALEEREEADRKERAEHDQRQREERVTNIVTKYAKGDAELAKQIRANFAKLNPEAFNKAITDTEIEPFVKDSFNLLGLQTSPDPLRAANNHQSKPVETAKADNFAEQSEGKDLMSKMGLKTEAPAPAPADGGAGAK